MQTKKLTLSKKSIFLVTLATTMTRGMFIIVISSCSFTFQLRGGNKCLVMLLYFLCDGLTILS